MRQNAANPEVALLKKEAALAMKENNSWVRDLGYMLDYACDYIRSLEAKLASSQKEIV